MFRLPPTFTVPAAPRTPSPLGSHPPSPHSTMFSDAYGRVLADRGAAPFPPQANVAANSGREGESNSNASVSTNASFNFASGTHGHDHHLHSSPTFASASQDTEDAEMSFEREFADVDVAQYFSFEALNRSSPFMTNSSPIPATAVVGNNASSPSHASPPPSSDTDGASPALSDSNSNFGFGSPSASWSKSTLQLPDTNTSPRSPLYSPAYDYPVLTSGPGLGFDGSTDGSHGALFAGSQGYAFDYTMGGTEPYPLFDTNPCADPAGLGLGFTPHAESIMAPWDSLDVLSGHPQPQFQSQQLPKTDFESHSPTVHHREEPIQMQGQEHQTQEHQQQGQQFVFPSEAMSASPRPRLEPRSSPAVSPRDLELQGPASASVAPSTPVFAARLWDLSGSSPMMLSDHGRSASDQGFFGHQAHARPIDFASPLSAPAAVPIAIPSSANKSGNSGGMNAEFHPYGHSLTQLFQPSSAPAQPRSGFGFMPPPDSIEFPSSALDESFIGGSETSSRTTASRNGNRAMSGSGNGSSIRARMRSYSQRMSSGFRDAQRAMFSTRASAGFTQGQVQQQQQGDAYGRDKMRVKAEEEKAWSDNLELAAGAGINVDKNIDISANSETNEVDMATVRVPFPRLRSSTSSLGFEGSRADPDATVRRKKRTSSAQTPSPSLPPSMLSPARSRSRESSAEKELVSFSSKGSKDREREPSRSELRPPKLAPSTWQLYFTDWIQRHQMLNGGDRKLNVAQAAKEAGAEYASLTPEQKEPYKRRSQALKEQREREVAAWQRTLTPDDIKRENAYRAAQRRAGKSRKGNIKDPNAPKKPLSAYFMFLQHIRADPERVRRVFGDEKETTAQSVLAAQTWRAMTDDERKPFLAKAEKEKLAYEAARRMYEEGTVGFETTISFSNTNDSASSSSSSAFPPNSPLGMGEGTTFVIGRPTHEMGLSSDSEPDMEMDSEGCTTDDERGQSRRIGRM